MMTDLIANIKAWPCVQDCDNGAIPHGPDPDGNWEAQQCQFCYERQEVIDALKAAQADIERHLAIISEQETEIERLMIRLEMWPVDPKTGEFDKSILMTVNTDGIACRDETIRLQDERIDKLQAEIAKMQLREGSVDTGETDDA